MTTSVDDTSPGAPRRTRRDSSISLDDSRRNGQSYNNPAGPHTAGHQGREQCGPSQPTSSIFIPVEPPRTEFRGQDEFRTAIGQYLLEDDRLECLRLGMPKAQPNRAASRNYLHNLRYNRSPPNKAKVDVHLEGNTIGPEDIASVDPDPEPDREDNLDKDLTKQKLLYMRAFSPRRDRLRVQKRTRQIRASRRKKEEDS